MLQTADPREVVLATRSPEALADFAARGAQVRRADFGDTRSVAAAFAAVDRLLLMFGGIAAPLVGLTGAHSAVPMAAVMAGPGLEAPAEPSTLISGTTAELRIGTIGTSGDQPRREVQHDHRNRH